MVLGWLTLLRFYRAGMKVMWDLGWRRGMVVAMTTPLFLVTDPFSGAENGN